MESPLTVVIIEANYYLCHCKSGHLTQMLTAGSLHKPSKET